MVDFVTPIIIIVIIGVLLAVVNGWIATSDRSFFDLAVKIPKFVDKPDAQIGDYEPPSSSTSSSSGDNNNIPITTNNDKPGMIQTYHQLRFISIFVMAIAFILGMIFFLGEEFGVSKKGQAIQLITHTIIYTILLTVFPILWDGLAVGLESLNVYILNPSNPTPDLAAERAKEVFTKVGGFSSTTTTDGGNNGGLNTADALLKAGAAMLTGNFGPITQFFHDSLTSVFRAFLAGLVFVMMFVMGTMRIVLTATIITGLPMILALKLIPWFRKVADKLIETLIGLVVATVISSIVIVAGGAYLDTLPHDTIDHIFQAWIAALAVVILAVFMPVMLSPMLGSIVSSVTGMVTTAFAAGAVAGSATVAGAAKGAIGGLQDMMGGGGLGGGGFGTPGFGGATIASVAGATAAGRLGARVASGGMEAIATVGSGGGPGSSYYDSSRVPYAMKKPSLRGTGAVESQQPSAIISPTLPDTGPAPVIVPETGSGGGAPSIKPQPILTGTSKPVIETPPGYKPDTSTVEDVLATGKEGDDNVPALAMQPASTVFTPEPTPVRLRQKFAAAAKGAVFGGGSGLLQGLGKGLMIEAKSAGLGDVGGIISKGLEEIKNPTAMINVNHQMPGNDLARVVEERLKQKLDEISFTRHKLGI